MGQCWGLRPAAPNGLVSLSTDPGAGGSGRTHQVAPGPRKVSAHGTHVQHFWGIPGHTAKGAKCPAQSSKLLQLPARRCLRKLSPAYGLCGRVWHSAQNLYSHAGTCTPAWCPLRPAGLSLHLCLGSHLAGHGPRQCQGATHPTWGQLKASSDPEQPDPCRQRRTGYKG